MQSEKYEVQNGALNSFCISYFALFTLHFRCSLSVLDRFRSISQYFPGSE